MAGIVKPISIQQYLEFEENAARESRDHWAPEYDAACRIGELCQYLTSMKISGAKAVLAARLLLEVESQYYGIVSQLLRRRTTDAMMAFRRAIETCAVAYRLWEHPELLEVFFKAYPNVEKTGDPKQWAPSNVYGEEFKTAKLFEPTGEVWDLLRVGYKVTSAMASHAGPAVISGQEIREKEYFAHFVESDDQEIRRWWYFALTMMFAILKVFLHVLKDQMKPGTREPFEMDLLAFRDRIDKQMRDRTPWTQPRPSSDLLLSPDQIGGMWDALAGGGKSG